MNSLSGLATAIPQRESQLSAQINQLREASSNNAAIAAEIEARFGAILRPEPPSPAGKDEAELVLVPVAGCIRDIVRGLEITNRQLRSILDRSEL